MEHRNASSFMTSGSDPDVILVRYLIEPKTSDGMGDVIDELVQEFKGNAWTDLPRELLSSIEKVEAYIAEININEFSNFAYVTMAYPACHFDFYEGGLGQLLALIAGDNISSKSIGSLRITDIFFPKEILASFAGPAHGVAGIRSLYNIPIDPILQVILKPRLGLSSEGYADLAEILTMAGAEAVREDQMMISTRYCPFKERVSFISSRIKDIEQKTGRPILYYPNISLTPSRIPEALDFLRKQGVRAVTVNAVHQGIGSVELIRSLAPDMILQAHRSGYVMLSNNRKFSISYSVLAQLYHLAGADEIHIGSIFGRFDVRKQETLKSLDAISRPAAGLKPAMPVISGNVFPGLLEANINALGCDIVLMAGSAVIGHPLGIEAGVSAFKEMTSSIMAGRRIETLLTNRNVSDDLLKALNLWPYKRDGINSDAHIAKLVDQCLHSKEMIDPSYIEHTTKRMDYYRTRFGDDEIQLISDSLTLSGRSVAGSIGQVAEKYTRLLCIKYSIPYHQFFSALEKLSEAGILSGTVLDGLHAIRLLYNHAKHEGVFIYYKETVEVINSLCSFFEFLLDKENMGVIETT